MGCRPRRRHFGLRGIFKPHHQSPPGVRRSILRKSCRRQAYHRVTGSNPSRYHGLHLPVEQIGRSAAIEAVAWFDANSETRPRWWGSGRPTRTDCSTCSATYRSGRKMSTTLTPATGFRGAVLSTTLLAISASATVRGRLKIPVIAIWEFVALEIDCSRCGSIRMPWRPGGSQ